MDPQLGKDPGHLRQKDSGHLRQKDPGHLRQKDPGQWAVRPRSGLRPGLGPMWACGDVSHATPRPCHSPAWVHGQIRVRCMRIGAVCKWQEGSGAV